MAPADARIQTKRKPQAEHSIYTAILGLTLLVLGGTIGFLCLRAHELFGAIFSVTGP